jgi:hypothetical protein
MVSPAGLRIRYEKHSPSFKKQFILMQLINKCKVWKLNLFACPDIKNTPRRSNLKVSDDGV